VHARKGHYILIIIIVCTWNCGSETKGKEEQENGDLSSGSIWERK
jgi:hypothetical protein